MRFKVILLGVLGFSALIFLPMAEGLVPAVFGIEAPRWLASLSRGLYHFISAASGWIILLAFILGMLRLFGVAAGFLALPFTRAPWK